MSTGHPTSSSKWKDLLGHFPHASTAMAAERLLELLLGTVEHDSEIRAAVQDQIWAPFKRAEESLRIVATSRSARHMAVDLSDREREILKQALDDFRLTAAASRDAQRCKASLAAASCARLLGWEGEADTLQRFARDELAAANSTLYSEYCQSQSRTKRIAHGYLN